MPYQAGQHTYDLDPTWGAVPDNYPFGYVSGIAVDREDRVYVFNLSSHELVIFDRDGTLLRFWETKYENVHGVHVDVKGNVFLVDRNSHVVIKYTADEKPLFALGTRDIPSETGYSLEYGRQTDWRDPVSRAAGPFNLPSGIAVADSGELFISDGYGNSRVHKFSADGKLLKSWGLPGKSAAGEFHLVHGLAIDRSGRVLVCDRMNDRVQVFDQEGGHLATWTGFRQPSTVAVGRDGTICVSEHLGRLSILSEDGGTLARWGGDDEPDLFGAPHGVAIDSHGDIYVGDVEPGRRLLKLTRRH